MSLTVPFNYDPTLTDYGNPSRSYTCPAGKYALITITLNAIVYGTLVQASLGGVMADSSTDSATASFWVKAADVVATTETAANVVGSDNTGGGFETVEGLSTVTCTVNSNIVSQVQTSIRLGYYNAGANNAHWSIDGRVNTDFHVAEYTSIT